MKILVTDPIDEASLAILRDEGFEVAVKVGIGEDELAEIVGSYDALIVRSGTKVTAKIFSRPGKLRVVGRAGIGVDNIDVEAATRRGVIVMNTPGGSSVSTAEHTISLLFSMVRKIPQADASLKSGKWKREDYVGVELSGKTIGVIGLGRVGREVAKRAHALGMIVIGYDPLLANDVALKLGVDLTDLDTVYRRSDFLTFHVPLTPDTRRMFAEGELKKCKRGVRIINTARGGIVDEGTLEVGLKSGEIGGVALDVFTHEPPGDHPLLRYENVVVTPHLGASTEEAQDKVSAQIVRQVAEALHERSLAGVVNAAALQDSFREEIRPYVLLAEKMGSLEAQLMRGNLKHMTITCSGELLHQSLELLASASLKGCFSHLLTEPINFVNAPALAKEMGVNVIEKKELDAGSYIHLLTLEFETDTEKHTFSGTVFGHKNPRIVKIDGFHVEVLPEGNLLFYSNVDRPGMLASVGLILARAEINIAGVSLGRNEIGKKALTVMSLDTAVPEQAIREIRAVEGILEAKAIQL